MIRDEIIKVLQSVTKDKDVHLEIPEIEDHGDYSSNIAMQIAGRVKEPFDKAQGKQESKRVKDKNQKIQKNHSPYTIHNTPLQIAEDIVKKLRIDKELSKVVEKIEVAGPGFINFYLSRTVLASNLEEVINKADKYGSSVLSKGKTVVIDYSSPNIAKAFGIGHLRSTIIGQALYNLYSFLGYKVIGDNHLGDWGTQFGVLLRQITKYKLLIANLTIDKLEELYVDFHTKAEEKPELWDEARAWFKKLEEGDKKAREFWKEIKEISLKEFERIYKILGVKIDEAYGESFYEDKMQDVISEVRVKGLSKRSEGAEIVELHGMPPAILVKSDGTTTYYTRDLATIKFRIEKWNPDLIIYEVGSEQKLHFQQVFETARILYWLNGTELVHVAHGLIRFASGKISTRKGQTIKLEQVLREAVHRAQKIIEKSKTSLPLSGQANRSLSAKEKEEVSKAVGIGAVKYFDLMHHPESDIIFDWEKMFVMEGNSAPYLQYTFARTQSVLAKSQKKLKIDKLTNSLEIGNWKLEINDEEAKLLRSFIHFPEIIEAAATNYSPNLLCNYLFDLAQKYNNFYSKHRILKKEDSEQWTVNSKKTKTPNTEHRTPNTSEFRLALTSATGQILKTGLSLLGIGTPERM